jgi:tRNA(adenine34) deaminase
MNEHHDDYMRLALDEARKAAALDEVPVGAVIVCAGDVIARAHNLRERHQSATAHAEVLAIEKACRALNSWRLEGCTLYVTLEPCTMCVGASVLARVDTIVFGTYDPKGGSLGSLFDLRSIKGLNHYPEVVGGVLEAESAQLLKTFFKAKRNPNRTPR